MKEAIRLVEQEVRIELLVLAMKEFGGSRAVPGK